MTRVYKTFKPWYYIKSFLIKKLPSGNHKKLKRKLLSKVSDAELKSILQRVDYYCKDFSRENIVFKNIISDLKHPKTPKAYYFDTYEYARYFDENQPISYEFGDVTWIPEQPSIVKSRPISEDNQNSVLIKINRPRHYTYIKNDKDFFAKKDVLIGRCNVFQKHRYDFFEKYFDHPLCDLGQINEKRGNPKWLKPKISIKDHLEYKFILSLQGYDVATNLKWIMSSNSIAVMPKPTYETWFMEGKLQGGEHFIEIKPDFSDLEEQLEFYLANPKKCLQIISNANQYCKQFYKKNSEKLCNILVLEKYFSLINS